MENYWAKLGVVEIIGKDVIQQFSESEPASISQSREV